MTISKCINFITYFLFTKIKSEHKIKSKNALLPNIKDQETFHDLIKSSKKLYGDAQLVTDHENTFLDSCLPAKLYGLQKIHKEDIPMRLILATIGSANHKMQKV